jgi:hypothetical protein
VTKPQGAILLQQYSCFRIFLINFSDQVTFSGSAH